MPLGNDIWQLIYPNLSTGHPRGQGKCSFGDTGLHSNGRLLLEWKLMTVVESGYTMLDAPVPIWTLKLSNIGQG